MLTLVNNLITSHYSNYIPCIIECMFHLISNIYKDNKNPQTFTDVSKVEKKYIINMFKCMYLLLSFDVGNIHSLDCIPNRQLHPRVSA